MQLSHVRQPGLSPGGILEVIAASVFGAIMVRLGTTEGDGGADVILAAYITGST